MDVNEVVKHDGYKCGFHARKDLTPEESILVGLECECECDSCGGKIC